MFTSDTLLNEYNLTSLEELYTDIGLGNRTSLLVTHRLIELDTDSKQAATRLANGAPLPIKGTEGMMVNFAKCCWPIPGDHIVGLLSYGKGLTVHTESCKNIRSLRSNIEKCVELTWSGDIDRDFPVELTIEVVNRKGMLATLASIISSYNANIETVRSETRDQSYFVVSLIITVTIIMSRYHDRNRQVS